MPRLTRNEIDGTSTTQSANGNQTRRPTACFAFAAHGTNLASSSTSLYEEQLSRLNKPHPPLGDGGRKHSFRRSRARHRDCFVRKLVGPRS